MSEAQELDFSDVTLDGEQEAPEVAEKPEVTPEVEEKPEEKKPVEFSPEQQEKVNELLARKTAQRAESDRQREEERKRREELEAELAKFKQPARPEVPPMPDPYDDDYEQKMQARESALLQQAKYDAQKEYENQQAELERQAEIARKNQEIQETITTYTEKAGKLGIDQAVVMRESGLLANYIRDDGLLAHILKDEQGPLIGSYIVNNPEEAERIAMSDPYQAAAYIASVIKPKAVASRKPVETPSAPLDNPEGEAIGDGNDDDKWGTYA